MNSKRTVQSSLLGCLLVVGLLGCSASGGTSDSSTHGGGDSGAGGVVERRKAESAPETGGTAGTDPRRGSAGQGDPGTGGLAPEITVTVSVPDSFEGVPESLENVFFEPGEIGEEPYAFGYELPNPDIGVGKPLLFKTGQAGLDGEYLMAVVLYCKGGGAGLGPVPGVDWLGIVETPLALSPTSGTVDAGSLELSPAE